MLINRLLMVYGCCHFQARQIPEAPECWHHFSISGWPEVYRVRTKAYKQVWAKNYSRTKWHYLVKCTSWMTYNHMSFRQKEADKRNYYSRETIIRISLESSDMSISVFSFPPSNLASGTAIRRPSSDLDYFHICMILGIFRDYYYGMFGYCYKHYIFKKYFLRVDCPFKWWS